MTMNYNMMSSLFQYSDSTKTYKKVWKSKKKGQRNQNDSQVVILT